MHKIISWICGIIAILWIGVVTTVIAVFILIIYLLSYFLPSAWRHHIKAWLNDLPESWIVVVTPAIWLMGARHWKVDLPQNLNPKGIYLVIGNHQSWADIIIIYGTLNKKIAPIKFFMKKELLWQLPIIGIACKALGYPFLSRHSKAAIKKNPALKGKDAQSTQAACDMVKRYPSSLMIFPEGTRFTKAKQAKQNAGFKHLLKPKAGGVVMALNGVGDAMAGILSVTIDYGPHRGDLSFLKFMCDGYPNITVDATCINITPDLLGDYKNDPAYKQFIQQWLTSQWQTKDQALDAKRSQRAAKHG